MTTTLQERMAELMTAKGWTVGEIARIAGVTSAAVSQWVGNGMGKQSKSIGNIDAALRLERASGFSGLWLAKGKGPKHLENKSVQAEITDSVAMSYDIVKRHGNEDSPEEGSGDVAENKSALCQSIPTSMTYSAPNLKSAILLMGSLVGALDRRSRKLIGRGGASAASLARSAAAWSSQMMRLTL